MKADEETLYATYSLMLKQGFELCNNYTTHNWGVLADILPMHQYSFTSIHFPLTINKLSLGGFKTSVLILSEEKTLQLRIKKKTCLKVMVGCLVLHLKSAALNKKLLLAAGDEAVLSVGDQGQLVSYSGPAVVLHLAID